VLRTLTRKHPGLTGTRGARGPTASDRAGLRRTGARTARTRRAALRAEGVVARARARAHPLR
jgi:hypothetical protein